MPPTTRALLPAVTAGGLLLATALPAAAHPFFADGATVPANSLATVTLNMAHGCGTEASGGGDPTLEVAVEIPERFAYVEVDDVDGYEVEVEGDGPVPEVVTWTATDGGVPAPELAMDVVVEGDEGDEVYVRVFQGCEDFEYRWIGTPDEPADDPAVRLELAAADPDSPPPPVEEPADEDEAEDDAADDAAADDAADEPADDPADEADGTDEVDVEDADAADEIADDPAAADDGGGATWLWLLLGALALAGGGAWFATRRSGGGPPTDAA